MQSRFITLCLIMAVICAVLMMIVLNGVSFDWTNPMNNLWGGDL